MFQYEYARSALKIGLQLESTLGVNPYKTVHGLLSSPVTWLNLQQRGGPRA